MSENSQAPAKRFGSLSLLTIAAFAFALCSCAGSSSSGGGGGPDNPAEIGNPTQEQISETANNDPRSGSVTQGTRASAGVTSDSVSWQSGGGVEIAGQRTVRATTDITDQAPDDDEFVPDGVRIFADNSNTDLVTGVAIVVTGVTTVSDDPVFRYNESDPLVFGFWAYETAGGQTEFGVFADGLAAQETPSASIPGSGSARYTGQTFGRAESNGDSVVFVGDVEINADFDRGKVTGTIDNLHDDDEISGDLGFQVNLEAAAISDTDGGFFKGDTSITSTDTSVIPQDGVEGKWGGQFFGPNADHVGGTWGIQSPDSEVSAVGAFGAIKQ